MLRIKLVKSPVGDNWRNRATVEALGLRKVGQEVEHPDNPVFRGMVHKVKHLLVAYAEGTEAPIADAYKFRQRATRKDKTPPGAHPKH